MFCIRNRDSEEGVQQCFSWADRRPSSADSKKPRFLQVGWSVLLGCFWNIACSILVRYATALVETLNEGIGAKYGKAEKRKAGHDAQDTHNTRSFMPTELAQPKRKKNEPEHTENETTDGSATTLIFRRANVVLHDAQRQCSRARVPSVACSKLLAFLAEVGEYNDSLLRHHKQDFLWSSCVVGTGFSRGFFQETPEIAARRRARQPV